MFSISGILKVKPCLSCGCTDVNGYSAFDICEIHCKKCTRKISMNGNFTDEQMIEEWNKVNGKLTLKQKIEILRKQIKDLKKEPLV